MARYSAEEIRAWIDYFAEIFYEIMVAIVKSEPYQEDYGELGKKARDLTEEELRKISRCAADFFVHQANPSPFQLSRTQIARLKVRAIRHCL